MKTLFGLAKAACHEILQFEPDLLMILAHGGWAALWAAQALWEETKPRRFPKMLVTNLGREKLRRYEEIRSSVPCVEIYPFVADYAGDYETGYFLAWLSRQMDWQDALRRQILDALESRSPERILVLDDTTWEGGTYRLALGLLQDIFPDCEARLLAGNILDWREYIPGPWLLEHVPEQDSEKKGEMHGLAYHLAPGTEDVDAENSLDWRPVTLESKMVQDLSRFLPAETWLELPKWVESAIRQGVLDCHKQSFSGDEEERPRISARSLQPVEILMKHVWLHGRITRQEAAATLQISPNQAGGLLSRLVGQSELLSKGRNRGTFYVLPPDATVPHDQRPPHPLLDAYWVEQNRLMVSDPINGWDKKVAQKQIDWLLSQGIRSWIDLDGRANFGQNESWEKILEKGARRLRIEVVYLSVPLKPYQTPAKRQVHAVLEFVSQAADAGRPVCLQGTWNEIADAIAGCYLVSKGFTGKQALEELAHLRRDTYEPWRLAPARPGLRRLVKRWGKMIEINDGHLR